MSVKDITTDDLRNMKGKEGIIFQGCGGEVQEWIDGVNEMFTEQGILKEGTKFDRASRFQKGELTCLLFEFAKDVKLDVGILAVWRIKTQEVFGCKWLTDYVENSLGGFEENKTIATKTVCSNTTSDDVDNDCRLELDA